MGMGTKKTPDVSPGEARTHVAGQSVNARCLILNPIEAELVASKDADMLGYLHDLGQLIGGWEGVPVEFCDPLGEVVLTVPKPEGRLPWTPVGYGRLK